MDGWIIGVFFLGVAMLAGGLCLAIVLGILKVITKYPFHAGFWIARFLMLCGSLIAVVTLGVCLIAPPRLNIR